MRNLYLIIFVQPSKVNAPVVTSDCMPTIIEAVGAEPHQSMNTLDGVS